MSGPEETRTSGSKHPDRRGDDPVEAPDAHWPATTGGLGPGGPDAIGLSAEGDQGADLSVNLPVHDGQASEVGNPRVAVTDQRAFRDGRWPPANPFEHDTTAPTDGHDGSTIAGPSNREGITNVGVPD